MSVVCSHLWLSAPAPHVLPSFYHFPHLFPGGSFQKPRVCVVSLLDTTQWFSLVTAQQAQCDIV